MNDDTIILIYWVVTLFLIIVSFVMRFELIYLAFTGVSLFGSILSMVLYSIDTKSLKREEEKRRNNDKE